jgi:hypothetical protein
VSLLLWKLENKHSLKYRYKASQCADFLAQRLSRCMQPKGTWDGVLKGTAGYICATPILILRPAAKIPSHNKAVSTASIALTYGADRKPCCYFLYSSDAFPPPFSTFILTRTSCWVKGEYHCPSAMKIPSFHRSVSPSTFDQKTCIQICWLSIWERLQR